MAKSETVKKDDRPDSAETTAESGRSNKPRSKLSNRKKILFALIPIVGLLLLSEATLWLVGYENLVADPYESLALRHPLNVGYGEQLFFEKAENGLPGKELFSDDCHPTLLGHQLFAAGLVGVSAKFFGPTRP